jgi:hypothetical protein
VAFVLAALLFVVAVAAVAALLFFPVMLLAGPHSDLLPATLQPVVLLAGWAAVVGVPAWCARALFRRLTRPALPSHLD